MKRFERENKLPPYAVATLYISIGCIICTALFLYGSSLSKNSTTVVPALFQPREESASLALADTTTSSTDTPVTDTSASFDAETPYYAFTTLNTKIRRTKRVRAKFALTLSALSCCLLSLPSRRTGFRPSLPVLY